MKQLIYFTCLIFSVCICNAQIKFDLSNFKQTTETISLDFKKTISIKNMAIEPSYTYSYEVQSKTVSTPVFDAAGIAAAGCTDLPADPDNQAYQTAIEALKKETDELKIDNLVKALSAAIKKLNPATNQGCMDQGNELIKSTSFKDTVFLDLKPNQIITVTVTRLSSAAGSKPVTWVKIFKTEEKTRWLVHYGLTYAPSIISKTDKFFAFADTSTANRYTITKNNSNGPKPWDNISATLNFTYPFSSRNLPFDVGFTAGFGINAGFELSGHTGLSAIIGENVIISSGLAFLQRNKLRGEYKENQVIKTNLGFDALHEKVWLPEIFFTIGFRFGSNPFAKKSTSTPASTSGGTTPED